MDHLWFVVPGVLSGIVAGFLPGIGIFASMLILLPWLHDISAPQLLTFYVALASTTQYIGSITATVFGVPGEASSLPAVTEGHALYKQGQASFAISGAALGSFFGSMIVLTLVSALMAYAQYVYTIYNTTIMAAGLMLVIFLICFTSKNVLAALVLAALGYLLGMVGCSHIDESCFATLGDADLTTGLPLVSVIAALYVFPQLLRIKTLPTHPIHIEFTEVMMHVRRFVACLGSSARGSVIGAMAGFLPGVSTAISSNLAYMIEKWVQTRRGHYRPGNYASLVSAETANNAGALTCLLPLLVLGIPLVPSEALLNELLTTKGTIMGQDFSAEFFMTNLAVVLVLTNAIGLIMAWPFARYICYLQRVPQYWLSVISLCLVIFSVWIVGAKSWQGEYNMLVFVLLLPLGYMLRHVDTLPLIFVFIVQSRLESTATTMADML